MVGINKEIWIGSSGSFSRGRNHSVVLVTVVSKDATIEELDSTCFFSFSKEFFFDSAGRR